MTKACTEGSRDARLTAGIWKRPVCCSCWYLCMEAGVDCADQAMFQQEGCFWQAAGLKFLACEIPKQSWSVLPHCHSQVESHSAWTQWEYPTKGSCPGWACFSPTHILDVAIRLGGHMPAHLSSLSSIAEFWSNCFNLCLFVSLILS